MSVIRRRMLISWQQHGASPTLLYLDEAEISMLTVDGSSGASTYQLTPVFEGGGSASDCTWVSSNTSAVTVSNTGLVTAVGDGAATITCTVGGVSRQCTVTAYSTLPSIASLKTLKGGTTSASSFTIDTAFSNPPLFTNAQSLLFVGTSTRSSGTAGPVTRSYFKSCTSSYVDIGSTTGVVTVRSIVIDSSGGHSTSPRSSTANIIPTGSFDFDLYADSSSVLLNGSTISMTSGTVTTGTTNGRLLSDFTTGRSSKLNIMASAPNNTGRASMIVSSSILWHCYQDYIRYTNRTVEATTRVNYTRVPNRGTAGVGYDILANNVPSAWFGV